MDFNSCLSVGLLLLYGADDMDFNSTRGKGPRWIYTRMTQLVLTVTWTDQKCGPLQGSTMGHG